MGYKLKIIFIAIFIIFNTKIFSQKNDHIPINKVAATVDKYVITKEEVFDRCLKLYRDVVYQVTQELVIQKIIRLEAIKEKVSLSKSQIEKSIRKEIEKSKKQVKEKLGKDWKEHLAINNINEKSVYDEAKRKSVYKMALYRLVKLSHYRQKRLKVRQIMLKSREKAYRILKKIKNNADFSTLAVQESVSMATKHTGGILPIVFRGDFSKDVDKVLFSLKEGETSEVIKTKWGFHIFQIVKIYSPERRTDWNSLKDKVLISLEKEPLTPRDVNRWLKKMELIYKITFLPKKQP